MRKLFGLALLTLVVAGLAVAAATEIDPRGAAGAGGGPAPEIDPSVAVGALTLFGGGILVIRGLRRKS